MSNIIHQTFHGYDNGHKLLASSVDLSTKAKNILLRESDSPGEEFHHQARTCYSGYPIAESGIYVISKTWVAKEISRPGCVWTHSLLIPFALLARHEGLNPIDLNVLLSSRKEIDEYNTLQPIDFKSTIHPNSEENLIPLFSEIFKNDAQTIINSKDISFLNIIYILNKLWPKMKREFSFKTWAPKNIRSSSNFDKFNLIISDYHLLDSTTEYWAEDYFKKDSLIHEFNWKYGATLNSGKGGVFELYKAWKLYINHQKDELVNYLLRWKRAPISLVKHVIKDSNSNNVTLPLSYLISKYILTLGENDISNDLIVKVGEVISKNDPDFFKKIIASDFYYKEQFCSKGIKNIQSSELAELVNNKHIDLMSISDKDTLIDENFWKHLSTSHYLEVVNGYNSLNEIPFNVIRNLFKNIEVLSQNEDLYVYLIISNFNIDRNSHREVVQKSQDKVIKFINNGFSYSSTLLYDFIFDNYSTDALCLLSKTSLNKVFKQSSKKYNNTIRLIEVLSNDNKETREKTLEIIFYETNKKLRNFELTYLEMSKLRELLRNYIGFNIIFPSSLSDLLVAFIRKYSLNHELVLSENIENKINSRKEKKKNNIFWFLDF